MHRNQHHVHEDRRDHRLEDRDHDRLLAGLAQILQPEFVAHRERDKAERGVAENVVFSHIVHGDKANARQTQPPEAERPDQDPRHQIRGHGRQVPDFRQTGHEQSREQGDG